MAKKTIKIGTRNSQLAMWQAEHVQSLLESHGLATEIIAIETKGDKILHKAISKIGSKGVFTEELEEMLHTGKVDLAVHSAKDMASTLPNGLELIAYTKREKAHDVVVSYNSDFKLDAADKWLVGTSSTRRIAMLKHYYPNIRTTNMRGNLQTRMRKLEEGQCDALLLAYAGVHRMGYEEFIVEHLTLDEFTPQAGQGSVTIEVSSKISDKLKAAIREAINDEETEYCLLAERAYLKYLDGGCSIPSFVLAKVEGDMLRIDAGLISLSGKKIIRKSGEIHKEKGQELAVKLAQEVLKAGGDKILEKIKNKK
ncbi:hydroxymethylbilane synthase [Bernardetia sp.]|uniref:hydroxymethylbilane synthase n=1 Tax=Bernardetia sp. TaxID=1937974 RepID=UPI0025B8E9C8|nr:hydroxymethylbilane synthase [Bernardetia sp.]